MQDPETDEMSNGLRYVIKFSSDEGLYLAKYKNNLSSVKCPIAG